MSLRSSSVAFLLPMVQPIIRMIIMQHGEIKKQYKYLLFSRFLPKNIDNKTQLTYICKYVDHNISLQHP
jgi:hypothetical protein